MRILLAIAFFTAALCAATTAQAERRMFIVTSNADGYGVNRCLSSGDKCGAAVATAYCQSRQFAEAASFHKVDRDEITGSVPANGSDACQGGKCDEFVAILCSR
jgi:hypothetical protein